MYSQDISYISRAGEGKSLHCMHHILRKFGQQAKHDCGNNTYIIFQMLWIEISKLKTNGIHFK